MQQVTQGPVMMFIHSAFWIQTLLSEIFLFVLYPTLLFYLFHISLFHFTHGLQWNIVHGICEIHQWGYVM